MYYGPSCLPASLTKHLSTLLHPLPRDPSVVFSLRQISSDTSHTSSQEDGSTTSNLAVDNKKTAAAKGTGTTGTTLWMGAQIMSCYALETLGKGNVDLVKEGGRRKRVIELGGGVGYLALVLASMGYDVTTTDIQPSLDTVLRPNLTRNMTSIPNCPKITARELDWFNFGDGRAWLAEGSLSDDVEKDGSYGSDGFDMIFTTDTIYHPSLLLPLLSTLSSLSLLSPTSPPILLAIENRDPKLISQAITLAQEMGFSTKKISQGRVEKAVGKSGWGWGVELKGDWEGVEIWRWKFVGK